MLIMAVPMSAPCSYRGSIALHFAIHHTELPIVEDSGQCKSQVLETPRLRSLGEAYWHLTMRVRHFENILGSTKCLRPAILAHPAGRLGASS